MRKSAVVAGVALAAVAAGAGLHHWRTKNRGPVQRGFDVAARAGCFGCHGPGGMTGTMADADGVGSAPSFAPDVVPDYVKAIPEIREWILDGEPARLRGAPEEEEEESLLRMPAFRGVLSEREVSDLSAWIAAVADLEPPPEGPARAGRDAAVRLGCFGCHGPQGRGDTPNPRSLKGYIPAWDGADFPELARDDGEIAAWIRDGGPPRLRSHPVARFFLSRQAIRMPAYEARATDEDLKAITAYIRWLRSPR